MGVPAKPSCAVVFLMFLTFGVSTGLPLRMSWTPFTMNPRPCVTKLLLRPQSWCRRCPPRQFRQYKNSLDHKLGVPSWFSLLASATPRPREPAIHEAHWLYSALCSASNCGCPTSLKNCSTILGQPLGEMVRIAKRMRGSGFPLKLASTSIAQLM